MQAQSLIRTSRSIMLRPFHLRHTRGQVRTLNTDPLPPNLSGPEFIRHVLSELSKHADRIGDRITTRLVLTVVSLAVGVDIGVQSLLFGRTLTDIKKQTDKIPEIMEKQAHLEGIMEGM
ncbi:uncharacterized protein EV422DRAFT_580556, partial [Fimicolochytrium jonesii]|uniref:uncharacterized protein n=1 Tax=Fimicolochytrium jonesii TaxID=1396493 RepID=UPI0022FED6AB